MTPHELTVGEIAGVAEAHATAAKRAVAAGFKVIEIHAAHGYLLNEFMSPLANQRHGFPTGGPLENRIRITIETIQAIRGVIPADMPLMMKISAIDWAEGGLDGGGFGASWRVASKAAGVDLITCSWATSSCIRRWRVQARIQCAVCREAAQGIGDTDGGGRFDHAKRAGKRDRRKRAKADAVTFLAQ